MAKLELRETLTALTQDAGPSGFERPVAERAAELLRPLVDEVSIDRMGNLIGIRRCGRAGAKRLLLDAHLDEVALMVTGMEEGYLRICGIGVDPRMLPDREVTVLTQPPCFGVISCLPPHVQSAKEHDKAMKVEELYVDVGLSQQEAEARIPVGTPVVFRAESFPLGKTRFCGKSLDDRACFAGLLRALELLRDVKLDVDLLILGSSREEVGGFGAKTAAYALKPDLCVAVDVTHGETPDESTARGWVMELSAGPALAITPITPLWLRQRLEQAAKTREIPYQREILSGCTDTNGDDFQTAREGIATAVVSLPLRYMHTPVEVIDLEDLEGLARLLAGFVEDMGKEGASC